MFKFVKILPIEDTFFIREDIPENIKLSYDIAKINYMEKSPFKGGDIVFFQKDKRVYIWFVRYPLEENKVYIPESYLAVKGTDIKDGFLTIKKESSFNILVIKDKNLISQISYKKEPPQLQAKLKLLAKEYSILKPEIREISSVQEKYDLKDIFLFSRFEFSRENILRFILANISIPLSVIFISLFIYKFLDYKYLLYEKEKLQEKLILLKNENKSIKEKIRIAKEKKEFWDTFVSKELKYPFSYIVISKIAKIVFEKEGFIDGISYSPELLSMTIGLPKKEKDFIKVFLDTGLFKDVKILNSNQDRYSKDYEVYDLEFYIKSWLGNGEK